MSTERHGEGLQRVGPLFWPQEVERIWKCDEGVDGNFGEEAHQNKPSGWKQRRTWSRCDLERWTGRTPECLGRLQVLIVCFPQRQLRTLLSSSCVHRYTYCSFYLCKTPVQQIMLKYSFIGNEREVTFGQGCGGRMCYAFTGRFQSQVGCRFSLSSFFLPNPYLYPFHYLSSSHNSIRFWLYI